MVVTKSQAKKMEELIEKVESVIEKMEATQRFHTKQLELYQTMISTSIEENRLRLDRSEKRMDRFRNLAIVVTTTLVLPILLGAIDIKTQQNQLPTKEDIEKAYVQRYEAIGGTTYVIERQSDILREIGWTTEEIAAFETRSKQDVLDLYGYRWRTTENKE